MVFSMTFYQILWYFLIYSFIGWVIEVVFHAAVLGKIINRGFLNGPICPVYGFGMLAVLSVSSFIPESGTGEINVFILFIAGFILATTVEFIAGFLLDIFFHTRWWDYSDKPFNIRGYICLEYSIIWGLSIVFAVRIVHPFFSGASLHIFSNTVGWVVLVCLYGLLFADLIVTVAVVRGMNRSLAELDKVRNAMRIPGDKISEGLAEGTFKTARIIGEGRVQTALARAELSDGLARKKEELQNAVLKAKMFGARRLLKAFPNMQNHDYREVLEELKEKIMNRKNTIL